MTRNLMTLASRTKSIFRSSSPRPRKQHSGMSLENLEGRLSLSAFGTNAAASVGAPSDLVSLRKHAPAEVSVATPAIVGAHIGSPAAIQGNHIGAAAAIQGNHIGTPAIVGAHIGAAAAIQGNHIGTPAIVGAHIGSAAAIQGNHIGTPAIIAII